MFWSRRRRGAPQVGNVRQAMMPIPLTGGLISGEVRDDTGRPLADAEVSIFDRSGKRVAHSDTDAYGFFAAAVVPGSYRVRAEVDWGSHRALGRLTLVPDDSLTVPSTGLWVIDPEHSAIRFIARHIAMSRVHGLFREFTGHIRIAERFEDSSIEVLIDAASIWTGIDKRDDHLRSSDFLDVTRFPKLHFTSRRLVRPGGNRWSIDGELTLHGTTSDVQLDATYLGMQEWNGLRTGCSATTELHREHFTVNWQQMLARGVPVVGSTIHITLDVQAILQT